jgi:drug/metabolite transporter (DMT)-like permease
VYAQLLFATDTQRLLVLASPALAILSGGSTSRAGPRRAQLDAAMLGGFAGVVIVTLFDANDFGAQVWREAAGFVVGAGWGATGTWFRSIHNPKSEIPALPKPQSPQLPPRR